MFRFYTSDCMSITEVTIRSTVSKNTELLLEAIGICHGCKCHILLKKHFIRKRRSNHHLISEKLQAIIASTCGYDFRSYFQWLLFLPFTEILVSHQYIEKYVKREKFFFFFFLRNKASDVIVHSFN